MNAGKKSGQLAACFVLPVGDSMHAIFNTLKNAALILQSGAVGIFIFTLRPSLTLFVPQVVLQAGPFPHEDL